MKKKSKSIKKQVDKKSPKKKFIRPVLVSKIISDVITTPSIVFADYGGCK